MTNQEHPIKPPPELVEKLQDLGNLDAIELAYQAGADQELKACTKWLTKIGYPVVALDLLSMRRPKPPSLSKQAFEALEEIDSYAIQQMSAYAIHSELKIYAETIRDALERLKKLEESTND